MTVPGGEHGAWEQWLSDPTTTVGSTAASTSHCRETVHPVAVSWDTVIRFFRQHLQ